MPFRVPPVIAACVDLRFGPVALSAASPVAQPCSLLSFLMFHLALEDFCRVVHPPLCLARKQSTSRTFLLLSDVEIGDAPELVVGE